MIKKWSDLPPQLQIDEVKPYFHILCKKRASLHMKRILDLLLASFFTILFSPVMLFLAIAIKLDSKGPVFYRQERITQYGRIYRIFKFRTMVNNADRQGPLVTVGSDSRITRVGARLRKLRLDEIPQVFNILSGDMTFVGTRPEVKKYVDRYTPEMMATLLLPAGLTSTGSIKYKDEDEILEKYTSLGESTDDVYMNRVLPEKMKYNLKDIEKTGVIHDLSVMVRTVVAVIK
ncbi:MAG: sugar transferase [Hespellia sp.]|nr:sugar transferase [Hespellia sp.]